MDGFTFFLFSFIIHPPLSHLVAFGLEDPVDDHCRQKTEHNQDKADGAGSSVMIAAFGGETGPVQIGRKHVHLQVFRLVPQHGINQIEKFKLSLFERYKQVKGRDFAITEEMYQGEDVLRLAEAFAKATDLTVRVYYNDGQKSVYDISNYFRSELSAMAKDLLNADYWSALTDPDGQWAAAEAACPLKVSKQ